ncbi:MAG: hypothetical protein KAG95_05065 [Bacteroidales bacterium]|nr:hypothetical protein [Bacteroidales bacterium]
MKNILFILLFLFSVGLFAQENNEETQKSEELKNEIIALKKCNSSLNKKLNSLKYSQKKSLTKQNEKIDNVSSDIESFKKIILKNSESILKTNTEIDLLKKENERLDQLLKDNFFTFKLSFFILAAISLCLFLLNYIFLSKLPQKSRRIVVETKQEVDLEIQSVKVELTKEVKNIKKSINKINKDIKSLSEKE